MTDWQVVEGHQSRASCSPGAQVMVRPHPQVLSLLRGHSGDKPTGVPRPPVSMEMKRGAGRSSASHLYGQRFPVSEESALAFTAIAREPAVVCPTRTPTTPPTPTSRLLSLSFFYVVFYGASASARAANMSGPPCPGSAGPARPAGNSGEILD